LLQKSSASARLPGHGSATGDSHRGWTDITQTWHEEEIKPYSDLIKAGYNGAIMVAHVFNSHIDDYPASLSSATVDGVDILMFAQQFTMTFVAFRPLFFD
jgi:hypothetical protein